MSPPEQALKVSVVIPCRNERLTLAACLDALEAQDLPKDQYEILVVDGASTDGCTEIIRARGVRLLEDGGKGVAHARNIGIREARGEIVAFTDADCVPRFDWLSCIVAAFEDDESVGGVAGAMRMPRSSLAGRMEDNDARVHYNGYITSNVAYRRRVLVEVGGFHEGLRCAEDYDLAWRVLDAGYAILREPRAIVLHDPPEVVTSIASYLRKQFWYARHDVPTHANALARAWRQRGTNAGSRLALNGMIDAALLSTCTLASAAGAVGRAPIVLAASVGGTLAASASRLGRTAFALGEGLAEIPAMAALDAAKRLVRGAGTLVGLAELAWKPWPGDVTIGAVRGELAWDAPRAPVHA